MEVRQACYLGSWLVVVEVVGQSPVVPILIAARTHYPLTEATVLGDKMQQQKRYAALSCSYQRIYSSTVGIIFIQDYGWTVRNKILFVNTFMDKKYIINI